MTLREVISNTLVKRINVYAWNDEADEMSKRIAEYEGYQNTTKLKDIWLDWKVDFQSPEDWATLEVCVIVPDGQFKSEWEL